MILTIFFSLLSSVCYRAGGLSQEEKYWIPLWMRQAWVRDWLCPFFCLFPLFLQHPSWVFLLAYGAMGGAFSTYWKYKNNANYWLSGFVVGLACLPLIFCGVIWWRIILRSISLAVLWGTWCKIFGNDHIQEHGRGFLVSVTMLII